MQHSSSTAGSSFDVELLSPCVAKASAPTAQVCVCSHPGMEDRGRKRWKAREMLVGRVSKEVTKEKSEGRMGACLRARVM